VVLVDHCPLAKKPEWQLKPAMNTSRTQDDVISITYEVARIRGAQPIQIFSPFISYQSIGQI
jgi:hypothetical protein